MSIGTEIKEIIEAHIDWKQLFADIKESFKIDIDIEELVDFCSHNEPKYVKLIEELEEVEVERYHIDNEGKLTHIEDEDYKI
jgi:hypothetical protein